MSIPINIEQYGRVHNHGEINVSVSPDGLEHALDIDLDLVVAGNENTSPKEQTEEFARRLESLVEEYAI